MEKVYADMIENKKMTVEEFLARPKVSESMKNKVLAELDARGFEY